MKDHIWIPLALAWLFCQASCDNENGCIERTTQITNLTLILRLTSENLTATTADECVKLCCDKNSTCNMAVFNLTANPTNCFHAYCDPIDECLEDNLDKFKEDIVTYRIAPKEGIQRPLNEPADMSKPMHIASRTIKPRKGVDDVIGTSNSSSSEGQTKITTTITKLLSSSSSSSDQQTTSESYLTTLDILENDSYINTKNANKIDEHLPVEDPSTTTDIPNLDVNKIKHIVPRKGAMDNRPRTPFPTSASLPASKLMDQHPKPPIPTKQMAQAKNHSFPTENVTELISNPSNMASTSYSHNNSTHHYTTMTQIAVNFSTASKHLAKTTFHEPEGSNVKTAFTNSTKLPIKLLVSGSIDLFSTSMTVEAQNLDNLHFQQSIYLVVSLIIGFLILILVIGMVLKHVYGVWERRHYQRMDFLIDGLYNTRSAV